MGVSPTAIDKSRRARPGADVSAGRHRVPDAVPVRPKPTTGYAKTVGRVGALAVFLGVGTAISLPGLAHAETDGSSSSTSSTSSSTGSSTESSAHQSSNSSAPTSSTSSRSASPGSSVRRGANDGPKTGNDVPTGDVQSSATETDDSVESHSPARRPIDEVLQDRSSSKSKNSSNDGHTSTSPARHRSIGRRGPHRRNGTCERGACVFSDGRPVRVGRSTRRDGLRFGNALDPRGAENRDCHAGCHADHGRDSAGEHEGAGGESCKRRHQRRFHAASRGWH